MHYRQMSLTNSKMYRQFQGSGLVVMSLKYKYSSSHAVSSVIGLVKCSFTSLNRGNRSEDG